MTRRSPHTVTYSDLVDLAEEMLKGSQARYEGAQKNGTTNLDALRHRVECSKTLVRLLKKCVPGQQADLFALYQQVVK
jgi:hypothetical protein